MTYFSFQRLVGVAEKSYARHVMSEKLQVVSYLNINDQQYDYDEKHVNMNMITKMNNDCGSDPLAMNVIIIIMSNVDTIAVL